MARCEYCGNEDLSVFEVVRDGIHHTFDRIECAVYALEPQCANCGVYLDGQKIQAADTAFCCEACAITYERTRQ